MISALITVYHPSNSVIRNVQKIARQVEVLYICDNSPESNEEMFINESDNLVYRFFGENLGLSGAFNRILKDESLNWSDDDFVFFFDQDTVIGEDHIENMLKEYRNLTEKGIEVGCMGPVYFNTSNNRTEIPKFKKLVSDGTWSVTSVITSSMLVTYKTLKSVNFWNDDIFLDMADWDLCWRIMHKGKLSIMTEKVLFRHAIGIGEKKVGPLHLRVGNTYREYYQIRECLYLLFKRYTPLIYRIRFLAMLFVRSPLHLMFLGERRMRIKYIFMGIRDFFKKVKGPLDPDLIK